MNDSNAIWQASTTINSSGAAVSVDFGGANTASIGYNLGINVTGVIGDPQVLFKIQTCDDNASWLDLIFDEYGPISVNVFRVIPFITRRRYARLAWTFMANDPGGGSSNSSSLSSQTFSSSSSGGTASLTFFAGLTQSRVG